MSDRETPGATDADPRWLAAAWASVQDLYGSGIHPAAVLCVRHRGRVILDRSIGYASGNGPSGEGDEPVRLATPDTPFVTLSASKPLTAMLIHLLVERGRLRLDARVCEYVPEFGRHGKSGITLRHVLMHRAGIPAPEPGSIHLDRLGEPEAMRELVYDMRPASAPGTSLAYHALTGGFVLGEVVERVTGRPVREVLAEEIARPLGCRWLSYGVDAADVDAVARNYFTGLPVSRLVSARFREIIGFDFPELARISNDPRFLTGVIPAGNVIASANELCRFYQLLMNGGEMAGVQIFAPQTVRAAITEVQSGEFDRTLIVPLRYSLGFILGGRVFSLYGPDTATAYGHLGFTNIVSWADPEREVAAALMTSGKPLVYPDLHHWLEIPRRIGLACPKRARETRA